MSKKRGLLERLEAGEVVVGDGGFLFCMERRGYVKAGPWTPEATVENPEAVRQLHREFLRAGADVMQTFTFYASDDKLKNRGNDASQKIGCEAVNQAACDLAREVANEGDALVAGNICNLPSYLSGGSKEECQAQFKKQLEVFIKNDVDFLIGELFLHVEEAEWAIEVMKETGKPVVCCLTIASSGDFNDVSVKDCTLRIARAGADVIGVNCYFDPDVCLQTIRIMKEALDEAGIKKHLITQPIGYKTPECMDGKSKLGMTGLDEFPLALETRLLTRWDCHKYAREAYEIGVRYIGACCGMEPYHVRAIAEELANERGKFPAGSEKHCPWGEALKQHNYPWVRTRSTRSFWENLQPTSGRPYASSLRKFDPVFSLNTGHSDMKQYSEMTTEEEMKSLRRRVNKP
ncbi:betaine--homocysteine S-methyltransferase 1 isoform X2 [Exaiptasia diaphana]|uniref:Hcy-binding domain-containing protein n=1 Tax=Exaiptasia diaphana TaxID=2652724 RepID=A0A913WPH0_EXADI|nr:betaine--homocysteine S-methyltransferase 1 isoform X1 [Exaiptasia diaphana]XP_020892100.1 betaine--homocysteine S-methyltransferase 1 isoform X2 [Exaiptasia diaphana]KXJ18991.1 Betaine--homocysteine S-methyltransferase 1 [Exaiptasia diaphana]